MLRNLLKRLRFKEQRCGVLVGSLLLLILSLAGHHRKILGPRIMTLICDAAIFDQIPVKKEVKATVSGIYITGVRGIRGSLEQPAKKNGFWQKMLRKARGEEK